MERYAPPHAVPCVPPAPRMMTLPFFQHACGRRGADDPSCADCDFCDGFTRMEAMRENGALSILREARIQAHSTPPPWLVQSPVRHIYPFQEAQPPY